MQYKFPCVFVKCKDRYSDKPKREREVYTAQFPDWEKTMTAMTDGHTWAEVMYMATDLINLMCCYHEDEHKPIPEQKFSKKDIETKRKEPNTYIFYVKADTEKYRELVEKINKSKHGRRWLNAEKARNKYLYPRMTQSPEEMKTDTI